MPALGSAESRSVDARICGTLAVLSPVIAAPALLQQPEALAGALPLAVLGIFMLLRPRAVPGWALAVMTLAATALNVVAAVDRNGPALAVVWFLSIPIILHVSSVRRAGQAWLHLLLALAGITLGVHGRTGEPGLLATAAAAGAVLVLLTAAATWARRYIDRLVAQLHHQADHDPLTGLLNRTGLTRRLQEVRSPQLPAPGAADGDAVAVLVVDVDHFKRINDTHGHLTGDEALIWLGGVLRGALPAPAITARFGGEEFVIVLPGCDLEAARQRAEQLRSTVATCSSSRTVPLTISVGVATGTTADVLGACLTRADEALYAAKRNGRNRVEVVPSAAC